MKIALVSCHSPSHQELASITWIENKAKYCQRYGYYGVNALMPLSPKMNFEKFRLMASLIEQFDWCFATGTDSMVTDMSNDLESYLNSSKASVLLATDCNGINADNLFVKNDLYGHWFLQQMLLRENLCSEEQAALNDLYKTNHSGLRLCPQKEFNSYDYSLYPCCPKDVLGFNGQWQSGDFLIHWPGFSDNPERRVDMARKMMPQIKM